MNLAVRSFALLLLLLWQIPWWVHPPHLILYLPCDLTDQHIRPFIHKLKTTNAVPRSAKTLTYMLMWSWVWTLLLNISAGCDKDKIASTGKEQRTLQYWVFWRLGCCQNHLQAGRIGRAHSRHDNAHAVGCTVGHDHVHNVWPAHEVARPLWVMFWYFSSLIMSRAASHTISF